MYDKSEELRPKSGSTKQTSLVDSGIESFKTTTIDENTLRMSYQPDSSKVEEIDLLLIQKQILLKYLGQYLLPFYKRERVSQYHKML